jgi:alkylation response protein AidB-like acyl-CoA dehydrogenase
VQHKLAEMAVESLEARAGCELAALRSEHEADLTTLAACTKSRVAAAADVVGKHAIQLHGAMGVCEELPVAPAFRWLEAFAIQSGRPSQLGPQAGARLLADGRFARSAVLEERT